MAKGLLTNVKTTIQIETFPRFHMDKKEMNPRLPQSPETYVSIVVCTCVQPHSMVHLCSNEEGVVRNPMVYPSSDEEGMVRNPMANNIGKYEEVITPEI